MTAELDLFEELDRIRLGRKPALEIADGYLRGEQTLKYMAPALEEEFGGRVAQLVINWPEIITEQYENALDITGFRVPSTSGDDADASVDEIMWEIWKGNDLDEGASQLHTESIALGTGYVISGHPDSPDDMPIVSVESPFQAYTRRNPRTRRVSEGIKRWCEGTGDEKKEWGTLYLRGMRITFRRDGADWVEDSRLVHDLDSALIVPFPNRPRMLYPDGRSEFASVIPIADAINKMATDMMISGEFHAMPRRYVFGLQKEDFEDEHGNPISDWKKLAGGIWASEVNGAEVSVGQFPEADLTNFHSSIKLLFQIASIQAALPSYVTAFGGDNPASAEALQAAENTKNKRAERKVTVLGGAWAEVQRNNLRILGRKDANLARIETQFAPVGTPTQSQQSDYAMKLVTAGVIPPQQARMDLGYTQEERKRMDTWDRQNLNDPFISRISREDTSQEV